MYRLSPVGLSPDIVRFVDKSELVDMEKDFEDSSEEVLSDKKIQQIKKAQKAFEEP